MKGVMPGHDGRELVFTRVDDQVSTIILSPWARLVVGAHGLTMGSGRALVSLEVQAEGRPDGMHTYAPYPGVPVQRLQPPGTVDAQLDAPAAVRAFIAHTGRRSTALRALVARRSGRR